MALARNTGFSRKDLNGLQAMIKEHQPQFTEAWHGFLALSADEHVKDVHASDEVLSVDLIDGRTISVPLVWYPRLAAATPEHRAHWDICGGGYGIHWSDLNPNSLLV